LKRRAQSALRHCALAAVIAVGGACSGGPRLVDLGAYGQARSTPSAAEVARRYPKLSAEADAHYALALAASRAGQVAEARHAARLARATWAAAEVYAERRGFRARLAELQNQQRLVEEQISAARTRKRDAARAEELKARLQALSARATALRASGHPAADVLSSALADLQRAAEFDAARLVQTDELQARTTFEAALAWAEADAPETRSAPAVGHARSPLPERARIEAKALLTLAEPRWAEDRHLAETNRALAEVLREAVALPEAEATLEGRGLVVTLRALFRDGETTLNPERLPSVGAIAALAQRHPDLDVRVEGHTDPRKDAVAALRLTEDRARSAAEALVAAGVSAARVASLGRGADQPVADNETRDGRVRNRRIEFVFLRPAHAPKMAPPEGINRGGDPAR